MALRRATDPHADIGIAVPMMVSYERWMEKALPLLKIHRIDIYMVDEDGALWPEVQAAL
jgi:hypothetical protein